MSGVVTAGQAVETLADKLGHWLRDAVLILPNLAVAVVIVIVFWSVARLGRTLSYRLLARVTFGTEAAKLLSGVVYTALLVCGAFIALGVLQLDKTVTSLLTGVGILGLTLGFALQDIAANLVAGILIQLQHPFRVGDVIDTTDFAGRVDRITLRATEMTKLDGQLVLIPNKDIFSKPIINNSATSARRVELQMPLPPDSDLTHALGSARDAVMRTRGRADDRDMELFFTNVESTTLTLLVRFWITATDESSHLRAKSDAIQHLKQAFDTRAAAAR